MYFVKSDAIASALETQISAVHENGVEIVIRLDRLTTETAFAERHSYSTDEEWMQIAHIDTKPVFRVVQQYAMMTNGPYGRGQFGLSQVQLADEYWADLKDLPTP